MRIESSKNIQVKIEPPKIVKSEEKPLAKNLPPSTDNGNSREKYLNATVYDKSGVTRRDLEQRIPLSAPMNEPPPMTEPIVTTETIETPAVAESVTVDDSLSNPPSAQGLEFSETKGASDLAYRATVGEVYQFPDGKLWEVAEVRDDPATGFRAIVLKPLDPNDDRTILAFAGTDPTNQPDLNTNFEQWSGGDTIPQQYQQAAAFAAECQAKYGDGLRLTGHSLGGGLAAYASGANGGIPATTINPSPINGATLAIFKNNPQLESAVTNYVAENESISNLPVGETVGNDVPVEGGFEPPWWLSILHPETAEAWENKEDHGIGYTAPDIPLPVEVPWVALPPETD